MVSDEDLLNTDEFWAKIHHMRGPGSNELMYENLLVLVQALLALPASYGDSENCFSKVIKIDSED